MLSRPHSNVASQMEVLSVLQKLTTNRSIIFGAGNHELEFFGSLTFILLQLTAGQPIPMDGEIEDYRVTRSSYSTSRFQESPRRNGM